MIFLFNIIFFFSNNFIYSALSISNWNLKGHIYTLMMTSYWIVNTVYWVSLTEVRIGSSDHQQARTVKCPAYTDRVSGQTGSWTGNPPTAAWTPSADTTIIYIIFLNDAFWVICNFMPVIHLSYMLGPAGCNIL